MTTKEDRGSRDVEGAAYFERCRSSEASTGTDAGYTLEDVVDCLVKDEQQIAKLRERVAELEKLFDRLDDACTDKVEAVEKRVEALESRADHHSKWHHAEIDKQYLATSSQPAPEVRTGTGTVITEWTCPDCGDVVRGMDCLGYHTCKPAPQPGGRVSTDFAVDVVAVDTVCPKCLNEYRSWGVNQAKRPRCTNCGGDFTEVRWCSNCQQPPKMFVEAASAKPAPQPGEAKAMCPYCGNLVRGFGPIALTPAQVEEVVMRFAEFWRASKATWDLGDAMDAYFCEIHRAARAGREGK